MRIDSYTLPKSSFLSIEKDMELLTGMMMKNERLKKLLYYNVSNPLEQPNLTQEQNTELFGKNIKLVPKLIIDNSVQNYIIIGFDNFLPNPTNPEFRDNKIEFDIICHYDYWHLKDFQLRPYRIAAELDSLLDKQRLTGIGKLAFDGAKYCPLTDELGGLCMFYSTIHGEEDKKRMPNPNDELQFLQDFNEMMNQ